MAMVKKCEEIEGIFDDLPYFTEEEFRQQVLEEHEEIFHNKGLIEGIQKGIHQGKEQGIVEGKEQSRIDIAKNMLKNKFSIEDIVKCTGLSKNKLDSIINS